ncbi:MAG: Holliday junction branch migration protein RuvA [Candidatus Hydrogenedentes bacterium]|nr:Holliday junction branch migration protein RuvA [Candidatus Hydrogenedentota bacterium]
MFAFLRGTVEHKGAGQIALDVGGIGYAVLVPDTVHRRLAQHQEVKLLTYCHIREDAFQIYGFLKEEERSLFMTLLEINGVGPRVALAVVSFLAPAAFGRALLENDLKAFTGVPGVGKKLAQRILLEMKTKLGQDTELSAILGEPAAEAAPGEGDDVYEALISLGCTPAEARNAALHARKKLGPDAPAEELVRAALRSMARA